MSDYPTDVEEFMEGGGALSIRLVESLLAAIDRLEQQIAYLNAKIVQLEQQMPLPITQRPQPYGVEPWKITSSPHTYTVGESWVQGSISASSLRDSTIRWHNTGD